MFKKRSRIISSGFIAYAMLVCTFSGFSQSEMELAQAAQNPVANMYSLPLQDNTIWSVGPYNRPQNVLNIQPVIPVPLGSKINMINRIIFPVVTQPSFTEDSSTTGFGDINYTAWLSPSKDSKVIWGLGMVFQIPTASSSAYGSGEFGIGPSLVFVTMPQQWVIGGVINNIRTFGDTEENKLFANLFINYNFPGWYLTYAPIITANWNTERDQRWLVPIGIGSGKIVRLGGKLPLNISAHVYYNAIKPDYIGDWQTRFQLHFMFPTKKMREQMQGSM